MESDWADFECQSKLGRLDQETIQVEWAIINWEIPDWRYWGELVRKSLDIWELVQVKRIDSDSNSNQSQTIRFENNEAVKGLINEWFYSSDLKFNWILVFLSLKLNEDSEQNDKD